MSLVWLIEEKTEIPIALMNSIYSLNWAEVRSSLAAKIVIVVQLQEHEPSTHISRRRRDGRSASKSVDAFEQGRLDPWPNGCYALESAFVVRIPFFSPSSTAHFKFLGIHIKLVLMISLGIRCDFIPGVFSLVRQNWLESIGGLEASKQPEIMGDYRASIMIYRHWPQFSH